MKNLGYLECQKGGFHEGEVLNMVCLNSSCQDNVLCCCACVQELHANHKTKTLKKLLLDADTLAKNYKQQSNQVKKQSIPNLNTDIMANMVENEQKNIIGKLHELKQSFVKQIDEMEEGIHTYFKSLYQELSHKVQSGGKNPQAELFEVIELVQGSGNIDSLKKNVLRLIKGVNALQIAGKQGGQFAQPDEQSYLNFLKNSNIDIENIVNVRIKDLYEKLAKEVNKMKSINSKISSLWSNKLYKFDPLMLHDNIKLLNPFTVRASVDSIYQMALMNPPLSFNNQAETFTFRVNANDLEWVAVGVCYKSFAQKSNYEFKFNQEGHGCYMVSGNAGTWSHSEVEFNNVVKAFSFKQGDSITCTVTRDKICFVKNVPPELEESLEYSQKEYYELSIKSEPNDTLHPCVVCFYENTEVEYLPSFKNIQLTLPNYNFKFSDKTKHQDLAVINGNHLVGFPPTNYKSCILDRPIEGDDIPVEKKSVTFRVVKSTGGWIGVGLCHKNIVTSNNYGFTFQALGHGCYMISANGGSWSNINLNQNNIVRTFKFVDGDLVTVSLDEKGKKVIFKKGIERYELSYTPIQGDRLYPVVVMYYPDDEIDVLPDF